MQKNFLYGIVFSMVGMLACNEPDTVGLEVQPAGDAIGLLFIDSSTIITSTFMDDTIRTDIEAATQNNILIGYMNDDVFGTSTAALYSQIKPSGTSSAQDFSKSRFDSLVITLAYKEFYGDSEVVQTFQVFEVTETISDTAYYSNKTFTTSLTLLGERPFNPKNRTDSILIGTTKFAPHIRIKLTDDFGKRVFDNFNTITDNLKGIYIKALSTTGEGGIITFDATSVVTGMTLYYIKDTTSSTLETSSISFTVNGSSISRAQNFTHDFTTATNPIIFNNQTIGEEKCYVQPMGGVRTKIEFPYLLNYVSNLPVAINKAELVITVLPGTDSELAPSARLSMAAIGSDGKLLNLPDATSQTATGFGGTLYNGNQYRFNIAQYVQQVLTEKRTDYGLYLLAEPRSQVANRVIIAGGGNTDATIRMKLQLSITNLNP